MKKKVPHTKHGKNVPLIQISLGRPEINALMYALDQNKTALDGILEDSAIDLQDKILNHSRFYPEDKDKNKVEVVSLQFVGEEITLMLQQFVGIALSNVEKTEEVADFFESIKQEHQSKNQKET